MGAGGKKEYALTVEVTETMAVVAPAVSEHRLPMSNLDLLLPPMDVGIFFCYQKPTGHEAACALVVALKASLADALSMYYPFTGEVVTSLVCEPRLLCNNCGVDFAVACTDIELTELLLTDPDDSIEGKLVKKKTDGVLCVQATELKCGGAIVGYTFDHCAADAYSTNMFLVGELEEKK